MKPDSPVNDESKGDAEGTPDYEPTEAQIAADRELATQFAVASLTGWASLVSVYAGAAATAFAPIALAIALAAVKRIGQRRIDNATDTLMDGAEAANMTVAEFIDKAAADDRRHELFARALSVAQDAASRNKRRALGRALAAGVVGDDARIDEELLFIRTVDHIDEMHIRLLGRLVDGRRSTANDIAQADPSLGDAIPPLLGQLQSQGLIDSRSPVTPGGAMTPVPYFQITNWGWFFVARLEDDNPPVRI